jgi:hypothetical protein
MPAGRVAAGNYREGCGRMGSTTGLAKPLLLQN